MIPRLALVLFVSGLALAARPAFAEPSSAYLSPHIKVGDRFDTIFSKAVAIKGAGFDVYVKRISGSASDTIKSIKPEAIGDAVDYLYDGSGSGAGEVEIRDHGVSDCSHGKCTTNDQTSATLFNPFLWGDIPAEVSVGSTWTANIAAPWEIGPAGREAVRVVRLDREGHLITLERDGVGQGPSSDDQDRPRIDIVSKGRTIAVKIVPGESRWRGYTTVAGGVTLSDEIETTRPVTLVADNGETFQGEERVYTLFVQAP